MDSQEEKKRLITIIILTAGIPLLVMLVFAGAAVSMILSGIWDATHRAERQKPVPVLEADLSATDYPNVYRAELMPRGDRDNISVRCCAGQYVMIDGDETGFAKNVLRSAPVYVKGDGVLIFAYQEETGMERPLIMHAAESDLSDLQELETEKDADAKTVSANTAGEGMYWVIDYNEWLRVWGMIEIDPAENTLYQNDTPYFTMQIPVTFPYCESDAEPFTDAYGIVHTPLIGLDEQHAAEGARGLNAEQLTGLHSLHEYLTAYRDALTAAGAEIIADRKETGLGAWDTLYLFVERYTDESGTVRRLTAFYETHDAEIVTVRYAYDDSAEYYHTCMDSLNSFSTMP